MTEEEDDFGRIVPVKQTTLVHIEPGQWVLAFQQGYEPFDRPLAAHLEMFARRGGGWDSHRKEEIFSVKRVTRVMPKTFVAEWESRRQPGKWFEERSYRYVVIASCQSQAAAVALRDKFFAIGVDADDRIEEEMHRRIASFAAKEHDKALKKIHACLPHLFGRDA
jgi:hypothetical protein